MSPTTEIHYLLAIPSWDPKHVTPFQGFAPGLLEASRILTLVVRLPVDVEELTMDPADRLARRRAGFGDWLWSPITIENLERPGRSCTPLHPFMVVFTVHPEVARRVASWRRKLRVRPLHVSTVEIGSAIRPDQLDVSRLQQHCLIALRQARACRPSLDTAEAAVAIAGWRTLETRPSSLRLHSHGVTQANEMVLLSAGEAAPDDPAGVLNVSPHADYVEAVTASAQAVRGLQAQTENRPIYRLGPPRPDVILQAPSMYDGLDALVARSEPSAAARRFFRALRRQRGFTVEVQGNADDIEAMGPVAMIRGAEAKLQTFVLGVRAASNLAATIRLPGQVNRTGGVVGHLARHLRHHDARPPDVKTARVFRAVQDALVQSVPPEHLRFIEGSRSGIKIVADAPLEWLPVGDLPLGIRFDVSRINTTPGNTLVEQLRFQPPIHLRPHSFNRFLVVSMFEPGDSIAHHVRRGLGALPEAGLRALEPTVVAAPTVDAFVTAVNAYDGPVLVVDSHGAHEEVGGLIIGGQPVDVWSLQGRLRPPPVVLLSACDTHPFDRNHATVANGFLPCGARAVLATVLPVRSVPAAMFVTRLLLRAISYGGAANAAGQAVPWTNVVGGALRMQLASDILRGLVERDLLPRADLDSQHLQANMDINLPRADWLERLARRCREAGGFGQAKWDRAYADILAGSDTIRYVHVGNPETIVLSDERVVQRASAEAIE
jgi:hypothetical protein